MAQIRTKNARKSLANRHIGLVLSKSKSVIQTKSQTICQINFSSHRVAPSRTASRSSGSRSRELVQIWPDLNLARKQIWAPSAPTSGAEI